MVSPRAQRLVQAALTRGADALQRNDLAAAEALAGEALRLIPSHPDALLLLGLVRLRRGDAAGARTAIAEGLERDPARPAAWVNLGRALLAQGEAAEARTAARQALDQRPDLPEAWLVLAHAELGLGNAPGAVAAALATLHDRPRSVEALGILGVAQSALGDHAGATSALLAAARLAPTAPRWRALATVRLAAADPVGALDALAHALETDAGDPATWFTFSDALLLLAEAPPSALPWLGMALTRPEVDTAMLGPIYVAAILADGGDPATHPLTAPSLARTLWRGPRAWALLTSLRGRVDLDAQDRIAGRLPWPVPDVPVPVLTDLPSDAVQAQYEADPYPRLVTAPLRSPRPFPDALAELLTSPPIAAPARPDVLVAGCGTGRHLRVLLGRFEVASVLAVDLSAASLRIAAEVVAGDPRVELGQADLRRLGTLGRTFDLVDAVGVLHHLADPAEGLGALRAVTRPGGFLRIGVYTRRAREAIVAARALVADLAPTPSGLDQALARLLALPPAHPAAPALRSVDAWTRPGLRDLLFHPMEHQFHPAEVATWLGDLEVLGVQATHPMARRWYADRFADDATQADLVRWDAVEAAHPDLFGGMLIVWVRKP